MRFHRLVRHDAGRPEADIGTAVLEARQHLLDRHVVEPHVHAWMLCAVSGDERRQQRAGQRLGRGDTHQPAAQLLQVGEVVEGFIEVCVLRVFSYELQGFVDCLLPVFEHFNGNVIGVVVCGEPENRL